MYRFIWSFIAAVVIGAIITPAVLVRLNYSADANWHQLGNQIGWASLQIAIIGALFMLVALVTPYVLGYLRRPKLDIELGPVTGQGRPWRFLHLTILNKPITGLFRFVARRDAAPSCRVRLEFMPLSPDKPFYITKPLFPAVEARWSVQPEPLRPTVVENRLQMLADPTMVVTGQTYSLSPSDEGSDVAAVVRHQHEKDAYAFNSYSYYYLQWKNPEWKVPPGEYLVRATVVSGQETCAKDFRLINLGEEFENFSLQPWK